MRSIADWIRGVVARPPAAHCMSPVNGGTAAIAPGVSVTSAARNSPSTPSPTATEAANRPSHAAQEHLELLGRDARKPLGQLRVRLPG